MASGKSTPSVARRTLPSGARRSGASRNTGTRFGTARFTRCYDRLEQPKIVVQFIAYCSQFAVAMDGYYVNNVILFVPSGELYLLAILNSRIMWWLMRRTFSPRKDGGRSVEVQRLLLMPVPQADVTLRGEIERTVQALLSP